MKPSPKLSLLAAALLVLALFASACSSDPSTEDGSGSDPDSGDTGSQDGSPAGDGSGAAGEGRGPCNGCARERDASTPREKGGGSENVQRLAKDQNPSLLKFCRQQQRFVLKLVTSECFELKKMQRYDVPVRCE